MQCIRKIKPLVVPLYGLSKSNSVFRFYCGKTKYVMQSLDHYLSRKVVAGGGGEHPYQFQENGFQDLTGIVSKEVSSGICLDRVILDRVPDEDISVDAYHL